MRMMLRTIALATALGLIAPASLPAQVLPQPVLTSEPLSDVAPPSTNVAPVQTKISSDLRRLKALGMMAQRGSSADAGSVLVVPAGEIGMDTLAAVMEDMTVMGRIFQTTVGHARTSYAFGMYGYDSSDSFRNMFMGQGGQNGQSIYLQGFGVLFTMSVDFPLSPGPQMEEKAPEEQADTDVDPVWLETQRQIFNPGSSDRQEKSKDEGQMYSAEKVERLKTDIIKALKHAANIRSLGPDEVVVVTVSGRPVPSKIESVRTVPGTNQIVVVDSGGLTRIYEGGLPEDMISAASVLTIRAKRSDIDSFAKGDSTLEQFRQRVQVISHRQLATGGGHSVGTSISTGYSR